VHDLQTVEIGHLIVDQRDIGLLASDHLDRLAARRSLGQHPDLAALREAAGDTIAKERMVVDNDHGDQRFHWRHGPSNVPRVPRQNPAGHG